MCNLPHTLKLFKSKKVCFFLHVSNVLGVCRGVRMQSHASYAEAWAIGSFGRDCVLIILFQLDGSKAGLLEGTFFWVGQYEPSPTFILEEKLIQY